MNQAPRDDFDDRLDAALRRRYQPPDPAKMREAIVARHGEAASTHRRGRVAWRIAAGIVLALAAVWVVSYALLQPPEPVSPYVKRTFGEMYDQTVARGFEPQWVCETDQEFADTFQRKLQQPLLLADASPEIEAIGLGYGNTLSRRTVHLLARVDGKPVMVFVDRAEQDAQQESAPKGLHLHRRHLGDLVLYELSPLQEPRLLDLFYIPEQPPTPSSGSTELVPTMPLTYSPGRCNSSTVP